MNPNFEPQPTHPNQHLLRKTLGIVVASLALMSCSSKGIDSDPQSSPAPDSSSTTIDDYEWLNPEPGSQEEKELECLMGKLLFEINETNFTEKQPANIAMNTTVYVEKLDENGQPGVAIISNPSVTVCEITENRTWYVLGATKLLGDDGFTPVMAQAPALFESVPELGLFAYSASEGETDIALRSNGKLLSTLEEMENIITPTVIVPGTEVQKDERGAQTREILTEDGKQVMEYSFIPSVTLQEIMDADFALPS